ncbi:hypothetical protein LJR029_001215 [Caballeronia sp. LjRoot29]|uniref:hypothetical protein n=1 Tax=Caballeronia sp. LjRoot29 TaxID=3342315 RepID=UPI003ED09CA1
MRQKAGPGLPLHLPILYRKRNSNSSGCLPFAGGSGLKGFMPAKFRRIFDGFFAGGLGISRALGPERGGRISCGQLGPMADCPFRRTSSHRTPETRSTDPLRYY